MGTGEMLADLFHPTVYLVHRLASAVALAGEQREHVGLVGLLAGADAMAAQDIDRAGRQGVKFLGVERSESPLHAQAREHWPFMASRWQEVPGLTGIW